ncbi:hypothetical protein [Luteococcus sanguinis]|uniref:DUF4365 domain-containing protein n=1 Tax=Luteococcus sanguinis TaxID=174038 RepID=A0ABW1X4A4_9ACTN
MTTPFELGQIFTTEPLATRALAAELRYHPKRAQDLAERVVSRPVGNLCEVRVERDQDEKADVLLRFEQSTIGIEAKFDHAITHSQIIRLVGKVDHLILLVVDQEDAAEFSARTDVTVMTWRTLLGGLPDSRITIADVAAMDDRKRRARRALAAVNIASLMPNDEWDPPHPDQASGSGMPSFYFGAPLTQSRWITVQVASDRKQGSNLFVINVGVNVREHDFDAAQLAAEREPEWISLVRVFCAELERAALGAGLQVSTTAGRGGSDRSNMKVALAKHWKLPGHYAVGYTDSYVGLKLNLVEPEALADVVARLLPCVETARQACIAGLSAAES